MQTVKISFCCRQIQTVIDIIFLMLTVYAVIKKITDVLYIEKYLYYIISQYERNVTYFWKIFAH